MTIGKFPLFLKTGKFPLFCFLKTDDLGIALVAVFGCGLGIVLVAVLAAVQASFLLQFDCGLGIVLAAVLATV